MDPHEQLPRPPAATSFAADNAPRIHHYLFAHVALRQVALDDPLFCLAVLDGPDGPRMIADLFAEVRRSCDDPNVRPDFGPADVIVHRAEVAGRPGAVIEMPPPVAIAEAHFTALVAELEGARPDLETRPPARYFTLEAGVGEDGQPRTVLGEWTADGTHCNYGDGPAPTVRGFIDAIARTYRPDRP